MRCPYCNEEMEKGYLQTARDLYWTKNPKKVLMIANLDDDILIGKTTFGGVLAEVDMCPNCKKIVIDIEKNAR